VQNFRCKIFCNTDTVSPLAVFISHGHLFLSFIFRFEVIWIVIKSYWSQIHISVKLNHTQVAATNILTCYCIFIHFAAYSIASWAVFMSHAHLLSLRGKDCAYALNVVRSQSGSNWNLSVDPESFWRFHCKLSICSWVTTSFQRGMI
jgi:hypothetical protein